MWFILKTKTGSNLFPWCVTRQGGLTREGRDVAIFKNAGHAYAFAKKEGIVNVIPIEINRNEKEFIESNQSIKRWEELFF